MVIGNTTSSINEYIWTKLAGCFLKFSTSFEAQPKMKLPVKTLTRPRAKTHFSTANFLDGNHLTWKRSGFENNSALGGFLGHHTHCKRLNQVKPNKSFNNISQLCIRSTKQKTKNTACNLEIYQPKGTIVSIRVETDTQHSDC